MSIRRILEDLARSFEYSLTHDSVLYCTSPYYFDEE